MDEFSWRADLVKTGINITHIDMANHLVYFDFAYRTHGARIWGKSVVKADSLNGLAIAVLLKDEVLALRKKLED